MIRNYIQIAVRNLFRKKAYTIINIVGLATGIAFCLLIYLYIQYERSFDTFHAKAKQLFRVEMTSQLPLRRPGATPEKTSISLGLERSSQIVMPVALASELQHTFPEIVQAVRFKPGWKEIVKYQDQSFNEAGILYADPGFLNMFSFPLLQGNPSTALATKNSVVISQKTARKYFGKADPIGKVLTFSRDQPTLLTVTGVLEEIPSHSSLQFDFLLPMESSPGYENQVKNGLNMASVLTIIELAEGVSPETFGEKLDRFGKTFFASYIDNFQERNPFFKASDFHVSIRLFSQGHYDLSFPWGHYTSLRNMYQLACLAGLILLIACLNYILLTLTHTAARSQEIGLRKVIGAARSQLIRQLWVETQVIVLVAVLGGWLLANIMAPYFNFLVGSQLPFHQFSNWEIVLTLLATTLIVGTLAGFYPALFISGFKPLSMIRKNQTFRISPNLSRVMVVVQYTTCIVMLIASLVIAQQMKFMNEKELGFDKEQVLIVENPDWREPQKTMATWERLQAYTEAASQIVGFSGTGHTFGEGYNINLEKINGKEEGIVVFDVDYSYFDLLGLTILQGRNFSPAIPSDTSRQAPAVVINETLYKMLGDEATLGEYNETLRRTIVGVVEDYHYTSVALPIGPAMHQLRPASSLFFWFRLHTADIPVAIQKLKAEWQKITDNQPFSYTFLDQDVAKLYESQQRWMSTINTATSFTILVACLGLFGLSGINALNRVKEIGIRKVMGASVRQVFLLLNQDIILLALVSFVLAVPVAGFLMHRWLQDFAYHIELSWSTFALAGGMGILMALMAVGYHSLRAALANPAESLKDE